MISPTDYKTISDYITYGYEQEESIASYLNNIIEDLNTLYSYMSSNLITYGNSFDNSYIGTFYAEINNIYNNMYLNKITNPKDLLNLVYSMQQHITRYYGDVNSFLEDNSIKVYQIFADLSYDVGYEIDASNIET